MKKKVSVSWSGGKDSAFALYKTISSGLYTIASIHTVFDESTRRVGLHGVPESLIERQAEEMGLLLEKIYLPASNNHSAYSTCMQTFYQKCSLSGIEGIVFGDIFLEDLKKYRLDLLRPAGLESFFPLWGMNTREMVNQFIDAGFKSVICAADSSMLDEKHVGRTIDRQFVNMLPPQVDACGENGEFHSFLYDGPIFKNEIPVKLGEVVQRTYSYQKKDSEGATKDCESKFWFQELSP